MCLHFVQINIVNGNLGSLIAAILFLKYFSGIGISLKLKHFFSDFELQILQLFRL